jgi:NAD(P)-dependent dehydrogenase (short-subunit alcohol dehydrogenase family)
MSAIRFDGQVAIVTGAGGGLGRQHALELARRGARVVVNDLSAADAVVEEIRAAGGEALANDASVSDAGAVEAMARQALDAWGRIDILIANAGILRDRSFGKMAIEDFQAVLDVHLMGTMLPIKAVWETMKAQGYGRIVVTTSSSGLYGNFGQANYGAAKMGIVGLMQTLKIEGQKDNIHINAISPVAATKMTEDIFPPAVLEVLKPEYVTPGVVYLCSAQAPTGAILTAGAGSFALARVVETEGLHLGHNALSAEAVRENWDAISDGAGEAYFAGGEQAGKFIRKAV